MRKAELDGAIRCNPARAVKPPKNLPQARREAPSKQQIKIIKNSVGLPFGLLAFLIYNTGCRRGEALALTGKDIDREKKRIRRSVYYIGNSPYIKDPKTESGKREVPLLDALDRVLPQKIPSGYLFAEPDGKLLANDHFTTLYDECRVASGVTVTLQVRVRHGAV